MSEKPRDLSEDNAAIGPQAAQITVRGQHTHVAFLSPVPPAEYIEAYKAISPDAPQQLLSIFLKQASHRMDCERADLRARIRIRSLGQWFGILFALTALIAGTVVAIWGGRYSRRDYLWHNHPILRHYLCPWPRATQSAVTSPIESVI